MNKFKSIALGIVLLFSSSLFAQDEAGIDFKKLDNYLEKALNDQVQIH